MFFDSRSALSAARAASRTVAADVFPNVTPFGRVNGLDPRLLKFKKNFLRAIRSEISPISEDGFVLGTGIPGDFSRLTSVGGLAYNPSSIPMRDNEVERVRMGLTTSWLSTRDRQIAKKLARLIFNNPKPAKIRYAPDSSSSFPFFAKGSEKTSLLRRACDEVNQIYSKVRRHDLDGLARQHNFYFCSYLGSRVSPDSATWDEETGLFKPKDRIVYSREYAKSNGRVGQPTFADKSVYSDSGQLLPNTFASRKRVVFAFAWAVNALCTIILGPVREWYLNEYAFTFKHREAETIASKLGRFPYIIGTDIEAYDTTYPRFLFDEILEALSEMLTPGALEMFRLSSLCPFYSPSVYRDKPEPFWMGNPLNINHFKVFPGLPSGWSINPDTGKYGGAFEGLILADRIFGDSLERMDEILKGEHPYFALLDMSDDMLMAFKNKEHADHYRKLLDDVGSGYFKKKVETPLSFLGNIGFKTLTGELKLIPNVQSYLVNWFSPERSASSDQRRYWYIGWAERRRLYSRAGEAFSITEELMEKHWFDIFGFDVHSYEREMRGLGVSSSSELDMLVLQNPDLLHYRITPEEISEELAQKLTSVVDQGDAIRVWEASYDSHFKFWT